MNASEDTAESKAPDISVRTIAAQRGDDFALPAAAPSYPDKRNYTLKEAALYLNVSTRTVERLIQRQLLRRNKALRKIFIPRTELDRFLERSL
ncbi:MAG: helix-turn-helix domain-containing protein [Verrucomicrobiota bacterium]|nr:helix-turn-helix domain-containing protein [Verrucomicrobiota bacterium]